VLSNKKGTFVSECKEDRVGVVEFLPNLALHTDSVIYTSTYYFNQMTHVEVRGMCFIDWRNVSRNQRH
jgi:hypothetical protein